MIEPMVGNWIGNRGEWIGGILWKMKHGVDWSILGYQGILFSPIYFGNYFPLVTSSLLLSSSNISSLHQANGA